MSHVPCIACLASLSASWGWVANRVMYSYGNTINDRKCHDIIDVIYIEIPLVAGQFASI